MLPPCGLVQCVCVLLTFNKDNQAKMAEVEKTIGILWKGGERVGFKEPADS